MKKKTVTVLAIEYSKKYCNEENTNNTHASCFDGGMHYTESLTYDFQKRIQGESLHEAISASRFSV